MPGDSIVNVLISLFAIGLLFYIVFVGYQEYRVARLRFKIFKLRDELFQEAAGGLIGFDEEAYRVVRILMNGHIQFAHRLTLWEPVILFVMERTFGKVEPSGNEFASIYHQASKDLRPEVKSKLDTYIERLNIMVTRHAFLALPEFFLLTIPFFFIALVYALIKELPKLTFAIMQSFAQRRVTDTAFAIGEREAHQSRSMARAA